MTTASESLLIRQDKNESSLSEAGLNALIQCMFPNHGPVEIMVHKERNDKGEEILVVKLSIAGEDIRCQGNFESEQAARECISETAVKFLEAFSARKHEILPVFEGSRFEEGMRQIFDSATSLRNTHHPPGSPFIAIPEEVRSSEPVSIIKPLIPGTENSVSPTPKVSCISFLTQYMQKIHPDVKYEPEFVSSNNRFGCKYIYCNKEFLVPAVYSNKQEAREALAKQICEVFMPGLFQQEQTATPSSTSSDNSINASGDFVSWVNVYCQRGNLSPPAYENMQENGMWRVRVIFDDQLFISSSAYPKVQSAKTNVAKQLSEYIAEKLAKNESINKGGVLERPKIPVPGPKSVQASPQMVPAASQPIPYVRPPVATVPYPMAYPPSGFYGMIPPNGQESTSMPLPGLCASPLHPFAHGPSAMSNMQPIPGLSTQAQSSLNVGGTDRGQAQQPNASIQNPHMASLYYQQYMAHMHHQMRLMQLQQQIMYQQQHGYPHSAPDGSHLSMMYPPPSFPIIPPSNHSPLHDPNNDPSYPLPPFLNTQNPPPS